MVGSDQLPGGEKETEFKPPSGHRETFHLFCIAVPERTRHHVTAGQDTTIGRV